MLDNRFVVPPRTARVLHEGFISQIAFINCNDTMTQSRHLIKCGHINIEIDTIRSLQSSINTHGHYTVILINCIDTLETFCGRSGGHCGNKCHASGCKRTTNIANLCENPRSYLVVEVEDIAVTDVMLQDASELQTLPICVRILAPIY